MAKENKKIHILFVDDDPAIRRLFGGRLADEGYEVIFANNGMDGRETARRIQPDLVLLDQNIPIMNGMEVAQHMKSEEVTRRIPIIMLTNEDFSLEAERLLKKEIGVDAYLTKSEDFSVIAETIKKVLASVPAAS